MSHKNYAMRAKAFRLKLDGLTYARIAAEVGVSRQRVQQWLRPPAHIMQSLMIRSHGRCEQCGIDIQAKGSAHVHHVSNQCIPDEWNELGNLQIVCLSCHTRHHRADPSLNFPAPYSVADRQVRRRQKALRQLEEKLDRFVSHGVMTPQEAETYLVDASHVLHT